MNIKTTVYKFTFRKIFCGRFLHFPGRYGTRRGPFKTPHLAWDDFVRVVRECYFQFDPEPDTEIIYEERVPVPEPYVPPTDYQI